MPFDADWLTQETLNELQLMIKNDYAPNERALKEEQIRSCMYRLLRNKYTNATVCVERGYQAAGQGCYSECDLWMQRNRREAWLECKRCWWVCGWNNKPSEQCSDWKEDLRKLRKVKPAANRYFVLVGVFSFDPRDPKRKCEEGMIQRIQSLCSENLLPSSSAVSFKWRDEAITHVGLWMWHWAPRSRIPF